jgi:PAS domain S-box-containing protein
MIITDGNARILHLNRTAEELVRQGRGLVIHNGALTANTRNDAARLRETISDVVIMARRGSVTEARAMSLDRPSYAHPLSIMDNAPAEIYLKDKDGRYLRINRRYGDLWRVKDEEVRGKLPGDIHSPKAFAEGSKAHDLAVLQSERAIEQKQDVLLEGSGHTLHMIKFLFRDADGTVSGLGAIATDITERKRAESRRTISLCQDGGKRAR